MDHDIEPRPFVLLGHRTIKALLNEEAFNDGQDLEMLIAPTTPVVSGDYEGKKLLTFTMSILISRAGTTEKPGPGALPTFSMTDTALGVTVEAGYVSRDEAQDGDLAAFAGMYPAAVDQLFFATRHAAQVLALESSFDASHIPTEVDRKELFGKRAASNERRRRATKALTNNNESKERKPRRASKAKGPTGG
ncbi:hypothetical protein P3W33_06445 [Luteibacter sp. PPL552]